MISQKIVSSVKNAIGTACLLLGAFLVCSTFVSMRTVLADPIAPINDPMVLMQQQVAAGNARGAALRESPRNRATARANVARTTVATPAISARTATARASNARANATRAAATRAVASRTTNSRATASRAQTENKRNVVSRSAVVTNRTTAANNRNVRARTAVDSDAARVSLQGSAIRGSKSSGGTTYSYLTNKLYTGNYSNIIDSTTGLISTDAFNNCLESYYACMDEICTARNQAQRRCACAGRVTAFAEAEAALETANEELIKASGELALLIANRGKDVSDAFQLTEAEQVMNCVSWREVTNEHGVSSQEAVDWCSSHGIFNNGSVVSSCNQPEYCSNNNFGFDIKNLNGSGSDILANLQAWAKAKENTITILTDNDDSLLSAFEGVSGVVNGLAGLGSSLSVTEESKDTLANTWGYQLFAHAHNEVCGRVLDSCFNGIYESCGSPASFGGKCANGQSSNCPFNYNSKIDVNASGEIALNERGSTSTGSINASASCFGYTTTSGDPYSNLRGPVADARRSIMNKYLLDANADCDLYGEQLRATAQNIAYQKVAAQQALQQKRLEFAVEEEEEILTAAIEAGTNFNECLSEIYDCYESTADSEPNWPDARIKTYCAQIANVPHCYEEMICNPSTAQFKAVIDVADSNSCSNNQDYTKNTCRNVVTLNEILNGTGSGAANIALNASGNSASMREQCLLDAGVADIRNWSADISTEQRCKLGELPSNAKSGYKNSNGVCVATACNDGYILKDGKCEERTKVDCSGDLVGVAEAYATIENGTLGSCVITTCKDHYNLDGNKCVPETRGCLDNNGDQGVKTWNGSNWGDCVISQCRTGYKNINNQCLKEEVECAITNAKSAKQTLKADGTYTDCMVVACDNMYEKNTDGKKCDPEIRTCPDMPENAASATQTWAGRDWSACKITKCVDGYDLTNGKCVKKE